jgi:hypothetical protein
MYTRVQKTSYFLANVLTISAILVFASGFFPHKAFLPGLAAWRPGQSISQAPPPFNRVIFMVVGLQFQFHTEVIIQQPVFCIQPLKIFQFDQIRRRGAIHRSCKSSDYHYAQGQGYHNWISTKLS